jgi:hypothetical protein
MNHKLAGFLLIAMIALLAGSGIALAQGPQPDPSAAVGTAFTYQGRLSQGGVGANGAFDFEFYLFDVLSGGSQLAGPISFNDLVLSDGYFTVLLNFGSSPFSGQARYLEARVKPGSDPGGFTILSPRQELTAVPYARYSLAAPWSGLSGVPAGFADGVDNDTTSFWSLTGNSGTNPASQYLGTSDNTAFELRVNGQRILRLEPNSDGPNLIGGYNGNWLTNGVIGATLFGGGSNAYGPEIGPNRVTDNWGTVSGGANNQAGDDAGAVSGVDGATIGGGISNKASGGKSTVGGGGDNNASGYSSTIGGGTHNLASGQWSTVGGGLSNTASSTDSTVSGGIGNTASGYASTIGGGFDNTASGDYAMVGCGASNTASGNYATVDGGRNNSVIIYDATIGGGSGNSINAGGASGTIGGGWNNTVNGNTATVPGGSSNEALAGYSFAAGADAHATHTGAFVWSSGERTDSYGDRTFTVRAHGGARFYTGSGTASGVQLTGGSWSSLSDRNAKQNFSPVDPLWLLNSLAEMPVQTWNYKQQAPKIRHIGPVAQDFNGIFARLFGQVEDKHYINTMDAVGISLAASQGLYSLHQDQASRIEALEGENARLKSHLSGLEQRLAALERGGTAVTSPSLTSQVFQSPWLLLAGLAVAGIVALRRKVGVS